MASLEEIKQDILSRVDIIDVVGQYVQLKRNGRDYKGLSPFTKEKTPSFVVHPDEQFFKCFSTGEAGDIFTFMMKVEGMDFMTAFKTLGKRAGLPVEDMLDRNKGRGGPNKERLYSLMGGIALHYRELLLKDPRAEEARAYVTRRNLDGEIGDAFLIGYAPEAWDTVETWAKENGYGDKELELSGMHSFKERDDGTRSHGYDRFRDRLMFPIRNEIGRVIGFSGRILDPAKSNAKYVNSPETTLFRKSKVLYAVDLARKAMVESRTAMICEGQIDVIRCHQHGFTNAVAAQGTALTTDHAKVLKRSADDILLVMDSDAAGVKAALKSGEVFLESGLAVKVAVLPEGDPDTILEEQGKDAFEKILNESKSFMDFQIDVLTGIDDPTTPTGLSRITQSLLESVVRIPSAVRQEQFLMGASQRLGISVDALRKDLEKTVQPKYAQDRARRSARAENRRRDSVPAEVYIRPSTHSEPEAALLRLLLLHPETRELATTYLRSDCIGHPTVLAVFEEVAHSNNPNHPERDAFLAILSAHPDCPDGLAEQLSISQPDASTEMGGPMEAMHDIIRRLHIERIKRRREELTHLYNQSGEIKRQRLWTEIAQITRQSKEFEGNNWGKASDLIRIIFGTDQEKPTF